MYNAATYPTLNGLIDYILLAEQRVIEGLDLNRQHYIRVEKRFYERPHYATALALFYRADEAIEGIEARLISALAEYGLLLAKGGNGSQPKKMPAGGHAGNGNGSGSKKKGRDLGQSQKKHQVNKTPLSFPRLYHLKTILIYL